MSTHADFEKLCNTSIGKDLTVAESRVLSSVMGVRALKDGELLSSEGGRASTLFILVEGKLDVISDNEGVELVWVDPVGDADRLRTTKAGADGRIDVVLRVPKHTVRGRSQMTAAGVTPADTNPLRRFLEMLSVYGNPHLRADQQLVVGALRGL